MNTRENEIKLVSPYSTQEFIDYVKEADTLRKHKDKYDGIRLKGLLKVVQIKSDAAFDNYLNLINKKVKKEIAEAKLAYEKSIKQLQKDYKAKVKKIKKGEGIKLFKLLKEHRLYLSQVKSLKESYRTKKDKAIKPRHEAFKEKENYFFKLNGEQGTMHHETNNSFLKAGKKIVGYKGFGLSSTIVVLLVLLAIFSRDSFYNWTSFTTVLTNNSVYAILAVGIMFVLLTGGIDISIASTLAVSACATSELMKMAPGINPILWVLVAIVIGAACGLINGVLIGKLNIAPMIATLGTMFAYRGLAYVITGGEQIHQGEFTEAFKAISRSTFLGITSATWIVFGIIIIATIFLALTKPGRRLYAIGTNEQSAAIAGTNVSNIKIMAYTICGALAGLSGIIFAGNYASVHSEIGVNFEMTAIAMCVIGGVSNKGGKGRVDCLVLGIFFLSLLMTLLARIPSITSFEEAIKGAIIIVAVVINIVNDNIKARKEVLEMGRRL